MIPLRDNNPTRRFPLITLSLIVANVAIFLVDQLQRVVIAMPTGNGLYVQDSMGKLSLYYSMIPAYVTGHGQGLFPPSPVAPWATIFTAMFLHANWLHVGGNMLYLWVFGNNIEDALGPIRFTLFYLLSGLGAAAVHILSDPTSPIPTIGASGAIAGVMGAYLLFYPRQRILSLIPVFWILLLEIPAIVVIGFWFVVQFLNSRVFGGGEQLQHGGGVAYMAHIGGFLSGMLLILLFGGRRLLPPPERKAQTYDIESYR